MTITCEGHASLTTALYALWDYLRLHQLWKWLSAVAVYQVGEEWTWMLSTKAMNQPPRREV